MLTMSSREDIESRILDYVTAEMLNGDAGDLSATTDLLALGLIDSLNLVMLRRFVQKTFDVNMEARAVANFANIAALAALVERLQRNDAG